MSAWDDYFWDSDSRVLRNKLGIRDRGDSRAAEHAAVARRTAQIINGSVIIERSYDASHFCAIHRHLSGRLRLGRELSHGRYGAGRQPQLRFAIAT